MCSTPDPLFIFEVLQMEIFGFITEGDWIQGEGEKEGKGEEKDKIIIAASYCRVHFPKTIYSILNSLCSSGFLICWDSVSSLQSMQHQKLLMLLKRIKLSL